MRKRPSPSKADASSHGDPLERALRALQRRERSAAELDRYLSERGVGEVERAEILETLARTSLVDDSRFAALRASSLAERGAGNDRIRHELTRSGVERELIDDVVAGLPPESERAERIVARRGASAKTARYLAGKGFSEEVVWAIVAHSGDESLG